MPHFTSLAEFSIRGQRAFAVESDRVYDRAHAELTGAIVSIDGKEWRVVAVERHLPSRPIQPGERISLLVREP